MKARFSPVAVGLLVLGIFFLVGFPPLSVVCFIASYAVQRRYRERVLLARAVRRHRREARTQADVDAGVRHFR